MKILSIVFFALISFQLAGCVKERNINLKSEDSMSITPDQHWAVVKVPYAAFLESSEYGSTVKTHARSGDIFLVKGKKFVRKVVDESGSSRSKKDVNEFETWYIFEEGFLNSSLLDIYDTKLKAENASKRLKGEK